MMKMNILEVVTPPYIYQISSTSFILKKPNEPPREWSSQTPPAQFKSRTSPPKTIPFNSAIMGRLNHNSINNGDVEVHSSDFLVESNSEYVPDPDTTLIKSIEYDKMYHIPEFLYPEHDENILDVDIQMLQA